MAIVNNGKIATELVATGSSATIAITTNRLVAAGDVISIAVGADSPPTGFTGAADNGPGLTWTLDKSGTQPTSTEVVGLFSAVAPVGGFASGTTITVTFNAASTSRWIGGFSFSGADTSASRVDTPIPAQHDSGASATTAWSTTSDTVLAGSIIVAATAFDINHPGTATSPALLVFTIDEPLNGNELIQAYQIVSAGGATVLNGTMTVAASTCVTISVAYKQASGVSTPDSTFMARPLLPKLTFMRPGGLPFTFGLPSVSVSGSAWVQNLADTITLSDAVVKAMGLSKSDTITLSDAIVKSVAAPKADTITLSDALVKSVTASKGDTITLSDALVKSLGLNKSDTITLSDVLTRTVTFVRSAADTITLSDALTKAMSKAESDTITLSDAIAKTFGSNKADSITLADAIAKSMGVKKSDTITLSDVITPLLNGGGTTPAAAVIHRIVLSRFGYY